MGPITRNALWVGIPAVIVAGLAGVIALDHDPMGEYSDSAGNVFALMGAWFAVTLAVGGLLRLVCLLLKRR